jgi:hypothetical protein
VTALQRSPRRQTVRHVIALALCALAAAFSVAQAGEAGAAGQQSRFARTVMSLQDAAPEVRSDFATIALSVLANAYSTEARLALRNDQDARAWTSTVEQYAGQIYQLLDDVELGLAVQLILEADQSLAINVGDSTVIVTHPRTSQQGALEQAILKEFCSRQECGQIESDPKAAKPISASEAYIRPAWSFTQHGSECSYEGITVRFSNSQNTAHARLICEQFLQEVMALADELAGQHRHGVEIQWEQLEMQSVPASPEHLVRLNPWGDSVLVAAPLLGGSPQLLQQVRPWLRQWLESSSQSKLEIDAASYGWQKP